MGCVRPKAITFPLAYCIKGLVVCTLKWYPGLNRCLGSHTLSSKLLSISSGISVRLTLKIPVLNFS